MVSAPTKPLKSPYITHLASFLSQNSPMNSVDEAFFERNELGVGDIALACQTADVSFQFDPFGLPDLVSRLGVQRLDLCLRLVQLRVGLSHRGSLLVVMCRRFGLKPFGFQAQEATF